MSWIILDGTAILTGTAGTALETVFKAANTLADLEIPDKITEDFLSVLSSKLAGELEGKNAVSMLMEWLGDDLDDDIQALFQPVSTLASENKDKRTIGWPSETYKKEFSQKKEDHTLSLNAEAEGTFAFTLGEESPGNGNVSNTLTISGALGTTAAANTKISKLGLGLNANFKFSTGATWTLERTRNNDLTGLAVAEALTATNFAPDDLEAMHNAPIDLKSIKLSRALGYGADAGATLNIPIEIAGISFGLNAAYQNNDKLDLTITRDDENIKVSIDATQSDTRTLGHSLGIKLAVPDILGDVANKVMKKIKGAAEFLESETVQDLLEPSKLVAGELTPLVLSGLKAKPKMANALMVLLDRDKNDIAETITGLLGKIIDDIAPIDRTSSTGISILDRALEQLAFGFEDIKKDISDGLQDIIDETLDKLYDKIPASITKIVEAAENDETLEKAIKQLVDKKVDTKAVQEAVSSVRKKLKEIAKEIEDAVNAGVSMNFAYKKVNSTSTTAKGTLLFNRGNSDQVPLKKGYQTFINKPLSTLDLWLPRLSGGTLIEGNMPEGVHLNDVELFERHSSQTEAKQSLSLAKILVANEQTTINKFFMKRSANGVMAGAKSAVKESSFWFGANRQLSWEGLFGHIDPKDSTTATALNPNQLIHISMTHSEGTLLGREIDRVYAPFKALDLIEEHEIEAVKKAAKTGQAADGTLTDSVRLRMAFTKADFSKMLNVAFPLNASGERPRQGNDYVWRDIAGLYFDAVEDAVDFRQRKIYRKAYDYRGNVAQSLGLDYDGGNKAIAQNFMAYRGSKTETFDRQFGSALSSANSVDRKARKHAGRLFLAPRAIREALFDCMLLNDMLTNDPDQQEAAKLQSSITKALSRAMYVDASKDAVTPWSVGLFGAFIIMARNASVKPALQLLYEAH